MWLRRRTLAHAAEEEIPLHHDPADLQIIVLAPHQEKLDLAAQKKKEEEDEDDEDNDNSAHNNSENSDSQCQGADVTFGSSYSRSRSYSNGVITPQRVSDT